LRSNHSMVRVAQNPKPYFTVSAETPPTWRIKFPYLFPPGTWWPSYTPRPSVPFTSSLTTRLLRLPRLVHLKSQRIYLRAVCRQLTCMLYSFPFFFSNSKHEICSCLKLQVLRVSRSAPVLGANANCHVSDSSRVGNLSPWFYFEAERETAQAAAFILVAPLLHFRTTYSAGRNRCQLGAKENCADIVFLCNAQIFFLSALFTVRRMSLALMLICCGFKSRTVHVVTL
jgi:hypothetical protein